MAKNKRTGTVQLKISKEIFFTNGRIMLEAFGTLEGQLRNALSSNIDVTLEDRESSNDGARVGVEAKSLNLAVRSAIKRVMGRINEETYVENGVFYQAGGNKGFDFALYDEDYNLARLFNYYVGMVGILNGDKEIEKINNKLKLTKREWKALINELYDERSSDSGDLIREKTKLTVVGEIQFGNWGLAYRDLFRLLNADYDPGVDFYVYITSTGRLKQMMSSQTVTYEDFCKIIEDHSNLVKVPMWVIGLDIENYTDSLTEE